MVIVNADGQWIPVSSKAVIKGANISDFLFILPDDNEICLSFGYDIPYLSSPY